MLVYMNDYLPYTIFNRLLKVSQESGHCRQFHHLKLTCDEEHTCYFIIHA
jgi:hypothetical protein